MSEPTPSDDSRIAWCITHDCVAVVYDDGSWACWHELVCGYNDIDHLVDLLPQSKRMTQKWAQSVFGSRLRAWAGLR